MMSSTCKASVCCFVHYDFCIQVVLQEPGSCAPCPSVQGAQGRHTGSVHEHFLHRTLRSYTHTHSHTSKCQSQTPLLFKAGTSVRRTSSPSNAQTAKASKGQVRPRFPKLQGAPPGPSVLRDELLVSLRALEGFESFHEGWGLG